MEVNVYKNPTCFSRWSVRWCGMKANYYGDGNKENCPDDILEQFAKTAEIMDASEFNFFRGITEKREMIDLYDIQYVF